MIDHIVLVPILLVYTFLKSSIELLASVLFTTSAHGLAE